MPQVLGRIVFWVNAARYQFFTGVLAPVLVGGAVAYREQGGVHAGLLGLTLLGLIFLHAAANLANDYYDHLSGNDAANRQYARPFTGGSRLIQQGRVWPEQVLAAALGSLALGGLVGLYLVWRCGWPVLVLGIVGGLSGFFYTAAPLALGYRGLGELFIALDFGVLPVLGTYYVQTGRFSEGALVASLPVALLISAVLWINQFQDYAADLAVGKRHWVVRLGRRAAARVYAAMMALAYVCLLAGVAAELLPQAALLALLTLPLAARGINVALREYAHPRTLVPANAATIGVHVFFSVLMALGIWLDAVVR